MAVPPSYSDLGKAARDLFTKGFSEFSVYILKFQKIVVVRLCFTTVFVID